MATMSQVVAPRMAFLGNDGKPASGYRLFTYAAGTANKVTTYTGVGGTTPNTNPIVLDARGECDVWALPGLRLRLELYPPGTDDPPAQSLAVWTGSSNAQPDGILGIPDPQVSEWVPYIFNKGDVCFVTATKILYIRGNVSSTFTAKRRVRITTQVGDYYATITTASATTGNSPASQVGDFNQSIVNIVNGLTSLVLDFDAAPGLPINSITAIAYGLFSTVNTSIPKVPVGVADKALTADYADVAGQAKDFFPGSNLEKEIITPGGRRVASAFSKGSGTNTEELWARYINLGTSTFGPANGTTATTMQLIFPKRSRYFAIDLVIGLLYGGTEIKASLRGIATSLASDSILYSCQIFGGTNTIDVRMAAIGTTGIAGENLAGKTAFTFTLSPGAWNNGPTVSIDDFEQVEDSGNTFYNPRTDGPIEVSFGVMPANNVGWTSPAIQDLFTQAALDARYDARYAGLTSDKYPRIDINNAGAFTGYATLTSASSQVLDANGNVSYYNLQLPTGNYKGRFCTYSFTSNGLYLEPTYSTAPPQNALYSSFKFKIPGATSDIIVMGGAVTSSDINENITNVGLVYPTFFSKNDIVNNIAALRTSSCLDTRNNNIKLSLTIWFLN